MVLANKSTLTTLKLKALLVTVEGICDNSPGKKRQKEMTEIISKASV